MCLYECYCNLTHCLKTVGCNKDRDNEREKERIAYLTKQKKDDDENW